MLSQMLLFTMAPQQHHRTLWMLSTRSTYTRSRCWTTSSKSRSSSVLCSGSETRTRIMGSSLLVLASSRRQLDVANSLQRRTYFFFPTSWKELELRWLRDFQDQRTVYVRLLNDQFQNQRHRTFDKLKDRYDSTRLKYKTAKGRARMYRLSYTARRKAAVTAWWQTNKSNSKLRFKAAELRWKTRSVAVRNRVIRNTRNYADRVQRVFSRGMMRVAAYYDRKKGNNNTNNNTGTINTMRIKPVTLTEYSEPSWFCATTGRPIASRDATGRFVNPWLSESTAGVKSVLEIAKWQWERLRRTATEFVNSVVVRKSLLQASQEKVSRAAMEVSSRSALSTFDKTLLVRPNELKFTWIGHATCLVQQGSINILTDPIFSERCSPFQSLPVGVARDVPPAVSMDDLPQTIDVCLISHDHYDHLDKESVLALIPRVQLWVVPLGIMDWLKEKCNVAADQIVELEWWESVKLARSAAHEDWKVVTRHSAIRNSATHPALTDDDILTCRHDDDNDDRRSSMWITCCPAQHWASRTFFDRNFRLWCSFAVFFPGRTKFFFGGDTALPEHFPLFDQIRDYVGGNIDLAALPVGAYEPSFYMADSHMNPAEAVRVHQVLDSKQSIGIHWGTFALSEESMDEPPIKLREAAEKAKVNFTTIRHGESITVDCRVADHETNDNEAEDVYGWGVE